MVSWFVDRSSLLLYSSLLSFRYTHDSLSFFDLLFLSFSSFLYLSRHVVVLFPSEHENGLEENEEESLLRRKTCCGTARDRWPRKSRPPRPGEAEVAADLSDRRNEDLCVTQEERFAFLSIAGRKSPG